MTLRLDLRTRTLAIPGGGLKTLLERPFCFGCADCDLWFEHAGELVSHLREHAAASDE